VEESWQHPQPKDETACQDTEVNKNQLARHKKVGFTSLVSSSSSCFNIPLFWASAINFAQEQVSYHYLLELESRSVITTHFLYACRLAELRLFAIPPLLLLPLVLPPQLPDCCHKYNCTIYSHYPIFWKIVSSIFIGIDHLLHTKQPLSIYQAT
jgi:hypothetical protein